MVLMYCDNQAAVISLNTGRCRETWTMLLIRCLFFIKAFYRLELRFIHLPGKDNVLADALSRNDIGYFIHRSQLRIGTEFHPEYWTCWQPSSPTGHRLPGHSWFSSCFRRIS